MKQYLVAVDGAPDRHKLGEWLKAPFVRARNLQIRIDEAVRLVRLPGEPLYLSLTFGVQVRAVGDEIELVSPMACLLGSVDASSAQRNAEDNPSIDKALEVFTMRVASDRWLVCVTLNGIDTLATFEVLRGKRHLKVRPARHRIAKSWV